MRTTLSLDEEVAERLRQEMATSKRSFKQVVNDVLRRGLRLTAPLRKKRYRVRPHASPFHPAIDPARLNQVVDELEGASFKRPRK